MPVITTVLERVASDSLGAVLAAEALLCAPPETRGNAGLTATEAHFERVPVTAERLGRLMMGAANRDDRTLDGADAEAALAALAALAGATAGTVTADGARADDAGSAGPERCELPAAVVALAGPGSTASPAMLAGLSRVSGVAIVRGADGRGADRSDTDGSGTVGGHRDAQPDPEALGRRIAAELSALRHPAGVVGALPLPGEDHDADPAAAARIEAAAVAALDAGTALVLAPRADPWAVALPDAPGAAAVRRALAAVDAAGLDRSRVVLAGAAAHIANRGVGGAPGVGVDPARLSALLELGTAICFDDLGRIPNVCTVVSDHDVATAILRCADTGAGDRILLSSGIRNKHRLTAFGGNGLEFVPQQFLPYLGMLGADPALVRAVGGGNAVRVFAREARAGVPA